MTPEAYITLAVVVLMFVALVREWYEPDQVVFGAMVLLLLAGVIDLARVVQLIAAAVVALIGVTAVAAMVFATRSGMAGRG